MRTLFAILVSLLLLTSGYTANALSSVIQLTRTNHPKYYSFLSIKTKDQNGTNGNLTLFRVIVTPPSGVKPENVSGQLSACRDGKLIVSCDVLSRKLERNSQDVDASVKDRSVALEFSISSDCIASSKFAVNLWEPDGPAFSNYWFYLKDFVDAK